MRQSKAGMTQIATYHFEMSGPGSRSGTGVIRRAALALVWVTMAVSGIVFTEPAPYDVLMLVLLALLPVIGLVHITKPLVIVFALWLLVCAGTFIGIVNAIDAGKALPHAGITLFLVVTMFVVAAFVARDPIRHVRLLMNGYVAAALIAAAAGIAGYFSLLPGAYELFTKFGRASGTFKDPNVFGPFLVPPMVYALHRLIDGNRRTIVPMGATAVFLGFAVLLSFSRGAWLNLGVALVTFAGLSFLTASSNRRRLKLLMAAALCLVATGALLAVALQFDEIGRLFEQRATLTQSYDEGPEGRFGGQMKAILLILARPLGIGPQQFAPNVHFEEAHNVYLTLLVNAGWFGGGMFIVLMAATLVIGARHAFRRRETQPLFLVAYACFVAHAVEGFLIDLDHWRHVFLLMSLIWGLRYANETQLSLADPLAVLDGLVSRMAALPLRPARTLIPVYVVNHGARARPILRRPLDGDDNRPGRYIGRRSSE
jgi:O-antigen ligase